MRIRERCFVFALSMLSLSVTTTAFAETDPSSEEPRQGQIYRRAPAVSPDYAQIVFFRAAGQSSSSNEAAHVYLNGELEGALMPDGYTRFCVKKGTHSVEAYIGDAPLYAGKADPRTEINVEGGGTYFLGVSENGTGEPVPFRRADAERLLKHSREQINIINRASAVVPCGDQPEPVAANPVRFKLDTSVLFDFGQGQLSAMTAAGRNELKKIAEQIVARSPNTVLHVTVLGHADPIGSATYNLKLSEERARTVGDVLSQQGVPSGMIRTVGMGSAEPVVRCASTGDRAKRISCNAPNRRVEINVESPRPDNEA